MTLKFRTSWNMSLVTMLWVSAHRLEESNSNPCKDTELHSALLRILRDQKEKDRWFESRAKNINKHFAVRTAERFKTCLLSGTTLKRGDPVCGKLAGCLCSAPEAAPPFDVLEQLPCPAWEGTEFLLKLCFTRAHTMVSFRETLPWKWTTYSFI